MAGVPVAARSPAPVTPHVVAPVGARSPAARLGSSKSALPGGPAGALTHAEPLGEEPNAAARLTGHEEGTKPSSRRSASPTGKVLDVASLVPALFRQTCDGRRNPAARNANVARAPNPSPHAVTWACARSCPQPHWSSSPWRPLGSRGGRPPQAGILPQLDRPWRARGSLRGAPARSGARPGGHPPAAIGATWLKQISGTQHPGGGAALQGRTHRPTEPSRRASQVVSSQLGVGGPPTWCT